jgi:hypothetical protein
MSYKEAFFMRIIGFVTFLYLPATFVSVRYLQKMWQAEANSGILKTFFSTDVVKYQNQGGNDSPNSTSNGNSTATNSTPSFSWIAL